MLGFRRVYEGLRSEEHEEAQILGTDERKSVKEIQKSSFLLRVRYGDAYQ
jgi:hypothetical protein